MYNRRGFIGRLALGSAGLLGSGLSHAQGQSSFRRFSYTERAGSFVLTPEIEAECRERIEKNRKGKFGIRIVDPEGRPLTGRKFRIRLLQHLFDWGNSGALYAREDDPSLEIRSGHFRSLFNCTTAKCYWDERWHQPIEHEEGNRIMERFRAEVDWAVHHGIRVKGHPLVWTVRKAIPEWMDRYSYPEQLRKLEAHVRDLIRVGGDRVTRWDLCNEMLWEPSLRNLPKRNWPHIETAEEILTYLEPAVHWARDQDPEAIYSLNDYGLVRSGVPHLITAKQQRDRYLVLLEEMYRRNCLPDAVGTQCHIGSWYTDKEFSACLDHLAQAGLPVQVTEFWARPDKGIPDGIKDTETEIARMENVRMIYTLAFSHPLVTHLTYWGGRFFDDHGQPTLLYKSLYQLIKEEWTTEEVLTTDADGKIYMNGFKGHYVIEEDPGSGSMKKAEILVENSGDFSEISL